MNRPRCETCLAFDPSGECHRRDPIHVIATGKTKWPSVKPTDWCLKHKPDPDHSHVQRLLNTWKSDQAVAETLARRYPQRGLPVT